MELVAKIKPGLENLPEGEYTLFVPILCNVISSEGKLVHYNGDVMLARCFTGRRLGVKTFFELMNGKGPKDIPESLKRPVLLAANRVLEEGFTFKPATLNGTPVHAATDFILSDLSSEYSHGYSLIVKEGKLTVITPAENTKRLGRLK